MDLDEINRQLKENPILHDLGISESDEDDSAQKKESADSAKESEASTEPVQSNAIAESMEQKTEVNEVPASDATDKTPEEGGDANTGDKQAETSEKTLSPVITLSDLFSDTASLSRTSLTVPEEANTRLFLLSQQLASDHPGAHSLIPSL